MTQADGSKWRIGRRRALVLGIPAGLLLGWLLFTPRFNELSWRLRPESRVGLGRDVAERHLLDGLIRDEVLDRLGQPLETGPLGDVWELGSTLTGVGFLIVSYDDEGRVAEVRFDID